MSDIKERGALVLVAEDDARMREVVVMTLEAEGYEVVQVADGGRLLVHVATHFRDLGGVAPALILSDVRMPVMTGLSMLAALRQSGRDTPVVLMTAFGDDDIRVRAEHLGARLLDKPFTMEALLLTVRAALEGRSRNAT